jgi:uncharacterized protein YegL
MRRLILFLMSIGFLSGAILGKPAGMKTAQQVAVNWLIERSSFPRAQISVRETFTISENGIPVYYVFNMNPSGFMIVSSDDVAYPVIGYSFEKSYVSENQPPAFVNWMKNASREIVEAAQEKIEPLEKTKREWERLSTEIPAFLKKSNKVAAVSALLQNIEWDQDWPYNDLCPPAPPPPDGLIGYHERCPTGCVATAMAQIMKSHNYPATGRGSTWHLETVWNGLVPFWVGLVSADFGSTAYDWSNMPDVLNANSSIQRRAAVSTLMFHCGVSTNMDYGVRGSGTPTSSARNAYVDYFDYSIECVYLRRNENCTENQWIQLMKDEIDNQRPVHYRGEGSGGGHSFVLDGYEGESHFHFNWGWSGVDNGMFYLSSLTAGGYDLSSNQAAIIRIIPTHNSQQDDRTPVLFVYQNRWEASAKGDTTDPIHVINSNPLSSATISYTISTLPTSVPWLVVSATSGTTTGNFTIVAKPNNTDSTRTCKVIVSSSTAGVFGGIDTIMVTQKTDSTRGVDVALVIDRSGSMSGAKIASAISAASTFVGLMQTGDDIAVVSFDDIVEVNFPLTTISSDAAKVAAQSAINALYARNNTSIGGGMQAGQGELNKGRTQSHQGMVLLTDGLENTAPMVSQVLPTIPSNTDIYTIGLGADADQNLLNNIAAQTGGQYFFAADATTLQQIYNIIRGTISNQQTFAAFSGSVSQGGSQSYTATVDALTTNALFSVSFQSGNIDLELLTPDGMTINPTNAATYPNIIYSKSSIYEFYDIKSPQAGLWSLRIIGTNVPALTAYTAAVQGTSDLSSEPFLDKRDYEAGQPIIISAILSAGKIPITGARVVATVQRPDVSFSIFRQSTLSEQSHESEGSFESHSSDLRGTSTSGVLGPAVTFAVDTLVLYDDGLHSDGSANDGLYANSYGNTVKDGSYTITIVASGSTSTAGSFRRENTFSTVVNPSNRPSAPALLSIPNGTTGVPSTAVLKWSVVANAASYQLQVSYLVHSPQSQTRVSAVDTLVNLDSLSVTGLTEGQAYYWRVRAFNSSGLASDWSSEWTFSTAPSASSERICYPNPFNPVSESVKFRFRLEKSGDVTVRVYDLSNSLVKEVLSNRPYTQGLWETQWDGRNGNGEVIANGVYIYVIESSSGDKAVGKVAVLR